MAKVQPITGDVLRWAIDNAGYKPRNLERDLDLPVGAVAEWMTEASQPNQGQLRKISTKLRRPTSFFFLPQPPSAPSVPVEWRKFAGTDIAPGAETLDGVKLASRVQITTAWVREQAELGGVKVPKLKKSDPVEESAATLRTWLHWSTARQVASTETDASTAKSFRLALESTGIVVMHLSLDEGLTRGFSLASSMAPLIAINTRDPYRARLFSYAHELVHLSTRSTSVCDVHESSDGLERFCNRVAAAILMPEQAFRNHVRKKVGPAKVRTVEEVSSIRNYFRASLRAAAIRLENLGLANVGLYDLVNRTAEAKKRGGQYIPGNERTKPVVRVDEYGTTFIRTVESGVDAGVLQPVQALTLLRLSEGEWSTARRLAEAGIIA
ncbi:MAG: ImmA/IrrE family metallo-endopeptidase [Actinobacteria bacterium]|nr:ImmA/IrrE family metallo-endopeptidase [Actinomycetota bacterium]MBU1609481.1 ImmA/IrrE family metallo-endopeptidase [Actinomycetota bacterium]MBU2315247.1 ImmA/IrrE family metallo-endopeptidase [Actinomycetota bacterium]MBU2386331.1 ImmA/IrrE family metallo-endopeptidase [Actinomycetota bacterium]